MPPPITDSFWAHYEIRVESFQFNLRGSKLTDEMFPHINFTINPACLPDKGIWADIKITRAN